MHPDLVAAGLALPVAERYYPTPHTAYHRIKPQVVALFPQQMFARLPTEKRYYTTALARSLPARVTAPATVAVGLLDPVELAGCADAATRMTVSAVEAWLAGAAERGHQLL